MVRLGFAEIQYKTSKFGENIVKFDINQVAPNCKTGTIKIRKFKSKDIDLLQIHIILTNAAEICNSLLHLYY
jgi:hypothetical protein